MEILIPIVLLIIGLAILVFGAESLVKGASSIASRFRHIYAGADCDLYMDR